MYRRGEWKHIGFERGKKPKKYNALLQNKKDKLRVVRVSFGQLPYEQYEDVAMGLYKHLNHKDKERRRLYHLRHPDRMSDELYYTSNWFSKVFLW